MISSNRFGIPRTKVFPNSHAEKRWAFHRGCNLVDLFVLNILNGISFGAVLFVLCSGLSLIFGVMGILNLSHGALYMIGAYVGWTIAVHEGLNFWLAVLAGGELRDSSG